MSMKHGIKKLKNVSINSYKDCRYIQGKSLIPGTKCNFSDLEDI